MRDIKTWLIVGLTAIIVILLLFQRSPADPDKQIYADSVKILKSQKAQISSRFEDLRVYAANKAILDSVQLRAQEREISRLKLKASKAVEAIPVRVMEENPEIGLSLTYKDSVITSQDAAIDSLKSSLAFQIQAKNDLMALHYDEAKISAQLEEMAQVRIIQLEKDLKKSQRRNRGLKALSVVAGVLGIIGGSQL